MPRTKISEFSSTPASNTDIDSINIAEGCAPSGINDAIRELMAQLKDFQTGAVGDSFNGPVGTTTAAAGAFTTLSASSTVTLSGGTANGVAFLNGSKVVTSGSALTFDGTTFAQTGANGIPIRIQELASVPTSQTAAYIGVSTSAFPGSNNGDLILAPRTSGGNLIKFYTGNGTSAERYSIDSVGVAIWSVSGSEQMRLTSTGLGIGTSSPSDKIHAAAATAAGLSLQATGTGGSTWRILSTDNAASLGGGYLGFNNGSYRMVLDSSGNLGLGVTPSAWNASIKAMEMPDSGFLAFANTNGNISTNTFFDTGYKYKASAAAARYSQSSGQHLWFTAPSGTAGNAITFTQAMTLDASGNLMVGTTTSSANSKLTLSGAGITIAGGRGSTYALNWADWSVYNSSTGNALVFDNGSERARIDSSGNLLVGKTAFNSTSIGVMAGPLGEFYLTKSTSTNADATYYLYSTGASAFRFYVGLGGTVFATSTTISAISDIRYKENVRDLDVGLDKIMALKPRLYDWKEGKGADIKNARGFIAQEFETVFPDLIDEWKDPAPEGEAPYKSVRADLIPVLVKAIQEQQAIIESLKARLDAANL